KFDEIDEKEGSNDDSMVKTTEDSIWNHRGFCITDDFKSVLIINLAPVEEKKTILDGTRSKQSFRFADAHVLLIFEEVPESRNFIPKVMRSDNNPGHDIPGAGAVTTDPSQSVETGIHDNSNRPSNHVMVESLSGTVTEPSDIPVSSTCLHGVRRGSVCAFCEEATPWLSFRLLE
ncbi:unnamed protein product, partial [Brassica napus]